jgi:hypothetical protein
MGCKGSRVQISALRPTFPGPFRSHRQLTSHVDRKSYRIQGSVPIPRTLRTTERRGRDQSAARIHRLEEGGMAGSLGACSMRSAAKGLSGGTRDRAGTARRILARSCGRAWARARTRGVSNEQRHANQAGVELAVEMLDKLADHASDEEGAALARFPTPIIMRICFGSSRPRKGGARGRPTDQTAHKRFATRSISTLSVCARVLARSNRSRSEELGCSSNFCCTRGQDLDDTGPSAPQSSCRARSQAARARSYSSFSDAVVSLTIVGLYAHRRLRERCA